MIRRKQIRINEKSNPVVTQAENRGWWIHRRKKGKQECQVINKLMKGHQPY